MSWSSPMLFAGAVLALSLFAGCKQGNGDRCEVASDCQSNFCVPGGGTPNSICCDPLNLSTCVVQVAGTGGSSGSGGSGGTSATVDAADATTSSDAVDAPSSSIDGPATDSGAD